MKQEQHFDKIIRKKMEDAESDFPFDESNWQKAGAMIDAERGANAVNNSKLFLVLGSLFLVLGTIGFFSYKYVGTLESKERLAGKETKEINSDPVSSGNTISINENEVSANSTLSENLNNTEPTANKSGKMPDASTPSEVKISVENKVSNKQDLLLNSPDANNLSHPEHKNEINSSVNNISDKNVASENAATTGKSRSNNSATGNKKGSILSPLGSSGNKIKSSVTNTNPVEVFNNDVTSAGSNMYENLFLNSKITKIPSHDLDDEIKKTPFDFIRIYDEDYYKNKRRKFHFIDAEAGATYMIGWNTSTGTDGRGLNGYAGLNYGFHIKKKFSATIGAQLYNISHITQPFYSGSDLTYGFGANGTYTTIASNSLYYIAIPLKINFAIDKRNTIGAGINAGFLFNGKNTVETYNISDGVKTNISTVKNNGYYEGTNTKNIMLTAFYNRAIRPRLKLNGEVMYGVSDVFTNQSSNNLRQNTIGLRVGLQYTLFDK